MGMTTVQALFPVVTPRTAAMIAAIAVPTATTVTVIPLIVNMVMTMGTMMMMTTMMMMMTTTMMTMTMMIAKNRKNRSPMTSRVIIRLGAVKSVKRMGKQVMICLIANQNAIRSSTLCLPSN